MTPGELRLLCPACRSSLELLPDRLLCAACPREWTREDGFYRLFDPTRLDEAGRAALHLHIDMVPRIELSSWHHFLSDARSHLTNGFIHRRLRRELRGQRVIDLGCGNGFMRSLLPADTDYVGIDFDPELLRRAARYHPALYLQASVEDVPLEAGQFDAVITTETLEHVHQPELLLRESHRLLRPGGQLLLSAPNEHCLKYRIKGHHDQHAVDFDAGILRSMVEKLFVVERLEQRGFWFPLPTGRHSLQAGWPMPAAIATNFVLVAHRA